MNAVDMVNRCFRRQMPEAYGDPEVPLPALPDGLLWGAGNDYPANPCITEEPMGQHPDHAWGEGYEG